jgi:hypothetical protein
MAEIGPNFNAGGWADNGPGTGGWSPPSETKAGAAPVSPSPLFKARGGATAFDSSKYNIDQYSYPSDLMSPTGEYGSNYVIFYINVASDSKLLKTGAATAVADNTPRDNGSIAALAATAVPSAQEALGIGNDTIAGTIAGSLTGQKKRIKTAIALHTPNQLSTSYSIEYNEEGMEMAALALAAVGGTAALVKAAKSNAKGDVAGNIKGAAPQTLAIAGSVALGNLPGGQAIQKMTGLAPNPRKEQIFKQVNFRKFTFDYEFFPRNAKEAENVLNIIYEFKLHMHPEFKDAMQFLYVYPSEFDIFHYIGGTENMNLNRQTSAVLTDMTVNYSPQGQFNTFENGMPTQINITLQFTELSTLTKEKIQDGM